MKMMLPFLLRGAMGELPTPEHRSGRPDPVLTPEQERRVQAALRAARAAGEDASHILVTTSPEDGSIKRIEVAGKVVWTAPNTARSDAVIVASVAPSESTVSANTMRLLADADLAGPGVVIVDRGGEEPLRTRNDTDDRLLAGFREPREPHRKHVPISGMLPPRLAAALEKRNRKAARLQREVEAGGWASNKSTWVEMS